MQTLAARLDQLAVSFLVLRLPLDARLHRDRKNSDEEISHEYYH